MASVPHLWLLQRSQCILLCIFRRAFSQTFPLFSLAVLSECEVTGEQPWSYVQRSFLQVQCSAFSFQLSSFWGCVGAGRTVHRHYCSVCCANGIQDISNYGPNHVKNSHCAMTCSFFSLCSSHSSGIQRTHPKQAFEATLGGSSCLWELHEQGPKGKRLWLQSLQPEQNCRHQIQHRQVG